MASVEERLSKLREERVAREKARIEKLRELNLKKYNKNEPPTAIQNQPTKPLLKSNSVTQIKNNLANVKNYLHVNGSVKRPTTAPMHKQTSLKQPSSSKEKVLPKTEIKTNLLVKTSRVSIIPKIGQNGNIPVKTDKVLVKSNSLSAKPENSKAKTNKSVKVDNVLVKPDVSEKTDKIPKPGCSSRILSEIKEDKRDAKINLSKFALKNAMRKSLAAPSSKITEKPTQTRKSMLPNIDSNKESVFERLYKPKTDYSIKETNAEKIQKDPNYVKKLIKNSGLIVPVKPQNNPVRRSISAVHFKRINKNELTNCIHKWSSVSDKLNKIHLDHDDGIAEEVTSAVKSERKKVKFMSPMCLNTPRPEELQSRLESWLQKRGKSLDSYHHLQCFGLHHLPRKIDHYDDENKENIAMESDSDDGSYNENMNEDKKLMDVHDFEMWRRVSSVTESAELNDSRQFNDTLTSMETRSYSDDVVMGALADLTELLREGFDWRQSARWLRAIRDRYPQVTSTASYWECRAALEEGRGDLPASVHCWEEAIAKGIGHSVVEANLDQLLDKFMQLKISPNKTEKQPNPKLVDVKNVFKSTIIRFAVTQAKLRQSQPSLLTVTPVRRSGRLSLGPSAHWVCDNMKQITEIAPEHKFTPNPNLIASP